MRNINHFNTKGASNVKTEDQSDNTKIFDAASAPAEHFSVDSTRDDATLKFEFVGKDDAAEAKHVARTTASAEEVKEAINRGRYMRIGRMMILASEAKLA